MGRPGIHETHTAFYYNKYYKKQLNTKFFGVNTLADLINMIPDAAVLNSQHILEPELVEAEGTHDMFVKLTEEARRSRQKRLEAGDESAKLKFSVLAATM